MKIPLSAIPKFEGRIQDVRIGADNSDIRKAIVDGVPMAKKQLEKTARYFKGASQEDTCRKIFDYLKNRVTYRADANEQIIQLPSALMRQGAVADCKSYSLFTAGILENLGISYLFVLTSYNANPIPQHIYVRTESGCIIDAVWGKFNSEKPPKFKYEIPMNVRYMAGLGGCSAGCSCPDCEGVTGLRETAQRFKRWVGEKIDDAKEVVKDVAQKAKTVGLGPGRGLFLVMVRANIDGIADKLKSTDQGRLRDLWNKAGGNWTILLENIAKGSKKPYKKVGILNRLKKSSGINGFCGLGDTGDNKLEAAIIAIGPAAGAAVGSIAPGVGTAAGAGAGTSLSAVLIALLPIVKELLKKSPSDLPADSTFYPATPDPDASAPWGQEGDGTGGKSSGGFDAFWDGTPFGMGIKGKHLFFVAAIAGGLYYANKKGYLKLNKKTT